MLNTTLEIIKAALKSDPSLKKSDRDRYLAMLRNRITPQPEPSPVSNTTPRLLRRADVAHRLSCSLRSVDNLPLTKVKLPGRTRAAGFLESDVNALLNQKTAYVWPDKTTGSETTS